MAEVECSSERSAIQTSSQPGASKRLRKESKFLTWPVEASASERAARCRRASVGSFHGDAYIGARNNQGTVGRGMRAQQRGLAEGYGRRLARPRQGDRAVYLQTMCVVVDRYYIHTYVAACTAVARLEGKMRGSYEGMKCVGSGHSQWHEAGSMLAL